MSGTQPKTDFEKAMKLIDDYIGHRRDFGAGEPPDAQTVARELADAPPDRLTADIGNRIHDYLTAAEWAALPSLIESVMSGAHARVLERRRKEAEKAAAEREQAAAQKQAQIEATRHNAEQIAREALARNFLNAEHACRADGSVECLTSEDWEHMRAEVVRTWASDVLATDLDDEQARAVGAIGQGIKVIARAGSGKTRVLTTRAMFLQDRCEVAPDEILLLAFNKAAAKEMRKRIADKLASTPHAMTFHALAHALVKPMEEILYDDPASGMLKHSRAMQQALREVIETPEGMRTVKATMSEYFRADLERLGAPGLSATAEEGLAYRRSLIQESMDGTFVRSFGEKRIANFLFEHDVRYRYEQVHEWTDGTPYHPDFTIQGAQVVIEYFGCAGKPAYDETTRAKIAFWERKRGWTLIALYPRDIAGDDDERVNAALARRLHAAGVPTRRRTNEELWDACRERATERMKSSIAGVLSRARAEGHAIEELRRRAARMGAERDRRFVETACAVLAAYEKICRREGLDDFSGLLWRAVAQVKEGRTVFSRDAGREVGDLRKLRFVLVDELQDLTPAFHALLTAIVSVAPGVSVFGVGDDWQSITRYAGANPKLFTDHPGPIGDGATLHLTTNYRSARAVVAAGNGLMLGRGTPAVASTEAPGRVSLVAADEVLLTPAELSTFEDDVLTPPLLRLIYDRTQAGLTVHLLARNNTLPGAVSATPKGIDGYLDRLRALLPARCRRLVTTSTIHRFKGREADVIIIVDALEGRYPFIHPEWIFAKVLGDTEATVLEDERCLFYVGLTRGKHEVFVVSEGRNRSALLDDVVASDRKGAQTVSRLAVPPSISEGHQALVVHNGYDIRSTLARLGLTLNRRAGAWWVIAPPHTLHEIAHHPDVAASGCEVVLQRADKPIARR